ncbi:MAG: hypothetical protein ABMB14_35695, partial [Myxococcota bacterium]
YYEGDGVWHPPVALRWLSLLAALAALSTVVFVYLVSPEVVEADKLSDLRWGSPVWLRVACAWCGWVQREALRPSEVHSAEVTTDRITVRRGSEVTTHAVGEIRSVRLDGDIVLTRLDGSVERFGAGWPYGARRDLVVSIANTVARSASPG